MGQRLSLKEQLVYAKANLRSLEDKIRASRAQVVWSQKAVEESLEGIAKLEKAIAREDAEQAKALESVSPL